MGEEEMLYKEYKFQILRGIGLGELMYSTGAIDSNTVLYT